MNRADCITLANDRKLARVETPEWAPVTHVHVRTVSLAERRRIYTPAPNDGPDVYVPRILVAVICDETGARIFNDDHAPTLAEKSSVVLDRILAAWVKLNSVDGAGAAEIEKKF